MFFFAILTCNLPKWIIILISLIVVYVLMLYQNLNLSENTSEEMQNGSSDEENLIFVHILHRNTSKMFAIIV